MSNSNNMANQTSANASSNTRTIEVRPQPVLRLSAPSGTLRLRAEPSEQRHIQWAEDVVDNEGMGKKSSKGTSLPYHYGRYPLTTISLLHLPQTACRRRIFRRIFLRLFFRLRVRQRARQQHGAPRWRSPRWKPTRSTSSQPRP